MDIRISYIEGVISEEELDELNSLAIDAGLDLGHMNFSNKVFASSDLFLFTVLVSPHLLQAISDGLISSAIYDAIKLIAEKFANAVTGKYYLKMTKSSSTENTAKLYIKSNESEVGIEIPANDTEAVEKALKTLVKAHIKVSK